MLRSFLFFRPSLALEIIYDALGLLALMLFMLIIKHKKQLYYYSIAGPGTGVSGMQPVELRRVRTLYACVGEHETELSFEPNQIISNGEE